MVSLSSAFHTSDHFLWARQCVTQHRATLQNRCVLSSRKLGCAKQSLPTAHLLHWLWPVCDLDGAASLVAVLYNMQRSQMVENPSPGMVSALNTGVILLECGYGWHWVNFELSSDYWTKPGIARIEWACLKDCLNRELLLVPKHTGQRRKRPASQRHGLSNSTISEQSGTPRKQAQGTYTTGPSCCCSCSS